jgi:hypothetical protein
MTKPEINRETLSVERISSKFDEVRSPQRAKKLFRRLTLVAHPNRVAVDTSKHDRMIQTQTEFFNFEHAVLNRR